MGSLRTGVEEALPRRHGPELYAGVKRHGRFGQRHAGNGGEASRPVRTPRDAPYSAPGWVEFGAPLGVDSVVAGFQRVVTAGELTHNFGRLQLLTLD